MWSLRCTCGNDHRKTRQLYTTWRTTPPFPHNMGSLGHGLRYAVRNCPLLMTDPKPPRTAPLWTQTSTDLRDSCLDHDDPIRGASADPRTCQPLVSIRRGQVLNMPLCIGQLRDGLRSPRACVVMRSTAAGATPRTRRACSMAWSNCALARVQRSHPAKARHKSSSAAMWSASGATPAGLKNHVWFLSTLEAARVVFRNLEGGATK